MQDFAIQPYDLLMLVVLVGAAVFGAWKGMAWQVASISSLVVSSIVAMRAHGMLAPHLSSQDASWNRFLAMLILFAATSLAIWIVFRWISGVINRMKLTEFDRQMGAMFGLAKGVLFCLVITFFAVTLSEASRQVVLRSKSGYYAAVAVERGTPLMPQQVRDVLGKYIDELDRQLDPAAPPAQPAQPAGPAATPGLANDLLLPRAGEGGFSSTGRPPAWDPALWRHDARTAVNNQVNALGQKLDQQVDQWGRRIDQQIDQKAGQLSGQLQQGMERFGSQFQPPVPPSPEPSPSPPLVPVDN